MKPLTLLDTGPLVALVKRKDEFHEWSKATLRAVQYPYSTCEPVITEALHLLSDTHGGRAMVMGLISDGVVQINFQLGTHAYDVEKLMAKYNTVPMDLADACLVRMAELNPNSTVVTIDSDFNIYRMNRNKVIPSIMPDRK